MSQANVLTAAANVVWYTDKAEIVTGATAVTYNIFVMKAGPAARTVIAGSATSGSPVLVTEAATANLVNGAITGTGVSTTVASVTPGVSLTLAANATVTSTGMENYAITVAAPGNLYSAAPQISASSRQQIYVGAGNYLTITGANFTARELGTASSATQGS